jgi:hypothetical protein
VAVPGCGLDHPGLAAEQLRELLVGVAAAVRIFRTFV